MAQQPLRLLCIDGGGVRGVVPLRILRSLSEATGGKQPHELFDLICGTSTGGILAYLLGALELSLPDCDSLYERLGEKVFNITWYQVMMNRAIEGARFSGEGMKQLIQSELEKLGYPKDLKMNDPRVKAPTKTRVFAVSSRDRWPYRFRNYDDCDDAEGTDDVKFWEAIRATSAAPIYFPNITINGDVFIDGGVGNNNPTNQCLQEVRQIPEWANRPVGIVVSLGTGKANYARNAGSLSELLGYLTAISTDSEAVHHHLAVSQNPFRYARFNPGDGVGNFALSDFENLRAMTAATDAYLRDPEIRTRIQSLGQWLCNPSSFVAPTPTLSSYEQGRDRDAWVQRWKTHYVEWADIMDDIRTDPAAALPTIASRPANGLVLARLFDAKEECDKALWGQLNKMRKKVSLALPMIKETTCPSSYMDQQGFAEAFNMSVLAMGLSAANAKVIKKETIELKSYGAILLMLLFIHDHVHVNLLRDYKANRDAYPEADANEVLDSARAFLIQCDSQEILLSPNLSDHLPKLRDLIEESTPAQQ